MLQRLTEHWWVPTLRGFCALVFGLAVAFDPTITASELAGYFGAYALLDGLLQMMQAITCSPPGAPRW